MAPPNNKLHQRPQLRLIGGDGKSPSKWLDFPSTVIARSPFQRNESAFYRFAKEDATKANQARRRQPIFEAWSLVFGEPPPVPNIDSQGPARFGARLTSISDAHACFRGIKRPVGDDDHGWEFVVYISKPAWFYVYEPSLACVAKLEVVPDDLVFATVVRLDQPRNGRYGTTAAAGASTKGVITHWQFIESEPTDALLPIGYRERYRRRLW